MACVLIAPQPVAGLLAKSWAEDARPNGISSLLFDRGDFAFDPNRTLIFYNGLDDSNQKDGPSAAR